MTSHTAFDGAIRARPRQAAPGRARPRQPSQPSQPRQPSQRPCTGRGTGWVVYAPPSVLAGDAPGSPFVAVFFWALAAPSPGRLPAPRRRDGCSALSFRAHPPQHLPPELPVVYVDYLLYESRNEEQEGALLGAHRRPQRTSGICLICKPRPPAGE